MDKEELINGYFEGTLDQHQLEEVARLLETDLEFASEFKFQKELQTSLKKEERQHLKAMFNDLDTPTAKPEAKVFKIRPWLIAASIALFAGFGAWFFVLNSNDPNTDRLYASNFTPYDNVVSPIERGGDSTDIEQEAFLAYENGEYQKALKLFSELRGQVKDTYVDFYQANVLMKLDRQREAIPLLENYIEANGQLADRATWYLSLCHLKLGAVDSSKIQLKRLLELGTFKSNAAQELLSQLD